MGLAEEWEELRQHTPVLVRDDRTTGAQVWVWDGMHRRPIIDAAEIQLIQEQFNLSSNYPTTPLPVVSYTILQRSPLAT
jgi:hypothetical protein